MKKTFFKLKFITAIMLLIGFAVFNIASVKAQVVASGDCGLYGNNLTWELTGTAPDYTLTISGSGEMADDANGEWFSYRHNIKTLIIGDSVTTIGKYAFGFCTGLTSVTIPNSVTTIGIGAFTDCSGLTSVIIGNSVTTIWWDAFLGCTGLTSVTIPNSLTTIRHGTFCICSGLTSVIIGNSVTTIEHNAFAFCTDLASITICAMTPPVLEDMFVFYGVSTNIPVYIPCGTYNDYSTAPEWSNFTNFIETGISDTIYLKDTICYGITYNFNGKPLNTAGIHYDTLQNTYSCGDTLVVLDLTIHSEVPITYDTVIINQWETYNFNGRTLNISDTYYDTLLNINNCDSIIELLLIVKPFISVDSIIDVAKTAIINVPLTLTGIVLPINAINQSISWHIIDTGSTEAKIYDNSFFAKEQGVAVIKAIIKEGKAIGEDYQQYFFITVTSNLGVEELRITDYEFRIYPNPTTGELTIDNGELIIESIEILDVVGRVVFSSSVSSVSPVSQLSQKTIIDISHLSSGIYFLKIAGKTVKIIKN